jgi:diguanylate cyclase (GGDEF)-like protein/PAS domain S-box-containing protein
VPVSSVNAVLSLDASGHITHFNPAAERTFGYRAEEILGESFLRLLAAELHSYYLLQVDRLFSDEDAQHAGRTLELRGCRRDGSEFPLELCLVTWRIDPGSLYSAIARDISERKEVERERRILLGRVEAMARTDELTGLPNRRGWNEELRRELARATRSGEPLCLGLVDLDRFKLYNDRFGHPAGDRLLSETATHWRVMLRVTDVIGRYGGDEFVLILPSCDTAEAARVVKRLRESIPRGQTASAGLAEWSGSSAEDLIAQADGALYAAKRAGRDRAVSA